MQQFWMWLFLLLPPLVTSYDAYSNWLDVYRSPCLLPHEDGVVGEKAPLNLCVGGETLNDYLYLSKGTHTQLFAHETTLYSGLHLGTRHSFHVKGRFFLSETLDNEASPKEVQRYLDSTYVLYQYGKFLYDPFQLTIGKHQLPFGIDKQPIRGFFSLYQPYSFWTGPEMGLNLTISNSRSLFMQVGAFTDEKKERADGEFQRAPQAYTARFLYNKPSWQGSKLILSLYQHRDGESRLGISLLNSTQKNRVIQFEFIRAFQDGKFWNSDYTQLLRFFVESAQGPGAQLFFLYDELHRQQRFAALGATYLFKYLVQGRLGLSYRKTEGLEKYFQWGLFAGLGAQL